MTHTCDLEKGSLGEEQKELMKRKVEDSCTVSPIIHILIPSKVSYYSDPDFFVS